MRTQPEFVTYYQQVVFEWRAVDRLDRADLEHITPVYVDDDDPQVAALYDIAWMLWRAGDIDEACLDDLLDIVFMDRRQS